MLLQRIQSDRIAAMKSRDELRKSILTCIFSTAKNFAVADRTELTESHMTKSVLKWKNDLKNIVDSLVGKENVDEFRNKSMLELSIVLEYSPKELTEEEHVDLIKSIIDAIKSEKEVVALGDVMKTLKGDTRVNGKLASQIAKQLIG